MPAERRSLSKPCPRVRPWDCLPSFTLLQQAEDDHAYIGSQALHLPALQVVGIHSFSRHLSSWHQAPESFVGPCHRYSKALWFRQCKDSRWERTQRLLHLFSLLSCTWTHFRCHELYHQNRYVYMQNWVGFLLIRDRRVVNRMCDGGIDAGPTTLPWWIRYRPIGWDHQGSGYPD